jgi:hypothetical protein
MVYRSLIAVLSDVVAPECPARSLSVSCLWRDLGYAVGALLSGVIADLFDLEEAIAVVGGWTLSSGILAARAIAKACGVGQLTDECLAMASSFRRQSKATSVSVTMILL